MPNKYSHLAANSRKRLASGSRVKKAKAVLAAKKNQRCSKAARRRRTQEDKDEHDPAGMDLDIDGPADGWASDKNSDLDA